MGNVSVCGGSFTRRPYPHHRDNGRVQVLSVAYVAHEPLHESAPDNPNTTQRGVHAGFVEEFW